MGEADTVLASVQQAFHDAFGVDPKSISLTTVPGDVEGWDSLGHITLVNSLEEVFNFNLDVDELMAMENVQEIVRIVGQKIQG